MTRRPSEKGSSMVLAILIMGVLVITTLSTALMLNTLKREAVYQQGLLMAEAEAQSGMEDALVQLEGGANWRSSFSITKKALKTGYYTVEISTFSHPTITATGYGFAMSPDRPFRSVEMDVQPFPIPQISSAIVTNGNFLLNDGVSYVDAYSSDISTSPTSFFTSSAVVEASGISWGGNTEPTAVKGNCYYTSSRGAKQNCNGAYPNSIASITVSTFNGSAYASDNDNLLMEPTTYLDNNSPQNFNQNVDSSVVTIPTGVYYVHNFWANDTTGASIIVDNRNGPVIILYTGSVQIQEPITNMSGYPADLVFYGQGGTGVTIDPAVSYNYYAVFEINGNFNLYSATVFGGLYSWSGNVTINNNYGPGSATAIFHYDTALQRTGFTVVRLSAGSYKAPSNVKL
jgi:hypothetical protein